MLSIVKKITILDKFKAKYKVAEVIHTGLPEWVDLLVPVVPASEIRMALDRYSEPLIRSFQYTPDQCLDRVPAVDRICQVRKGCFGWKEKCLDLKKNTCALLTVGEDPNLYTDLSSLVNLWRDDYYVVVAKTES